jgi:hypothetical protein
MTTLIHERVALARDGSNPTVVSTTVKGMIIEPMEERHLRECHRLNLQLGYETSFEGFAKRFELIQKLTEQQRLGIVAKWRASGLSIPKFAATHSINISVPPAAVHFCSSRKFLDSSMLTRSGQSLSSRVHETARKLLT